MKSEKWLPIIFGVFLGLSLGLYYAWDVNPVEYMETAPAALQDEYKADYYNLIALAYASTGNIEQAQSRLAQIPDANHAGTLGQLAQTRLAAGRPENEVRALAMLAAALGERPAASSSTSTPENENTATPTRTATITRPPRTNTPTATPGAPFEIVDKELVCDEDLTPPIIQIEVVDSAGDPVAGVEILVVWDEGEDHFFTGLKPELGVGYADFTMQVGVSYTLQLADSDIPITGLSTEECTGEDDEIYPGSWLLTFQQPAED
jgi:hypothetical protein